VLGRVKVAIAPLYVAKQPTKRLVRLISKVESDFVSAKEMSAVEKL
jgi:hypothetical protein